MNDIAFFINDKVVYMHGIIMMLAMFAVVLCAAGLHTMQKGSIKTIAALTAAAIPVGLLMSRFMYGFFALDSFALIPAQMLSGRGGNSLLGAALGVLIVVLAAKSLKLIESAADILDCIAPASALGLSVGRLSAIFSNDDRGFEIAGNDADHLITVIDEVSGQHVLAVYVYESIFAGMLFVSTLLLFILRHKNDKWHQHIRSGDTTLFFLVGFGGSQGVLESMRTDSLTVIGLGFVRVLQITALLCLLIPVIVFSIRAVERTGLQKLHIAYWVGATALLALAIYMEFTLSADFQVQMKNYTIMANCLIGVQLIAISLFKQTYSKRPEQQYRKKAQQPSYRPSNSKPTVQSRQKPRNTGNLYWN